MTPGTVLVTGGAGFIGSHVVDALLRRGDAVRVLDALDPQVHAGWPAHLAGECERVQADVRDRDAVRRALTGVDRVVHLAAAVGVGQSMYEIERYASVNTVGGAVVLEAAIEHRAELEKVVVASSMSMYGEGAYRCPAEGLARAPSPRTEEQLRSREWEPRCSACGEVLEAVPTPESKPLEPSSIYAITKRDHEEMFLAWGRAYRVPVTALRLFNVYGTRQALSNPYTGVTAIFAARLLNGRAPVVYEDGRQSRDFVHVSDVVSGFLSALVPGRADGAAVNLGTGSATTILEVAETVASALGVDVEPEVRHQFRSGDARHCFADIALARQALGYEPRVSFAEGMREMTAWLREQDADDRADEAAAALVARGLAT